MEFKELKRLQYECSAGVLREQQHNHLGSLRTYGFRLFRS